MKKRFVLAIAFACCALIVLVVRYLPPLASAHNLGDPADHAIGASFMSLDHGYDGLIRRSFVPARFNIPLADGRGAHSVSVRVGLEPPATLGMHVHQQSLAVDVKDSTPRTYHTLVPQATSRWVSITLSPPTGSSVVVDNVAAIGRPGWPPLLDLLVLMAVACVPALLMVLTARWPLDWAVLPSLVALLYFVLLPRDELGDVMAFGPLVALCIGCIGTATYARARPAITLLLLIGAALRLYALGWGGGYALHPITMSCHGRDGPQANGSPRYVGRACDTY